MLTSMLSNGAFGGAVSGATARAFGRKDITQAECIFRSAILIAFLGAIIMMLLFFSFSGLLFSIYQLLTIPPSYTATATIVVREKPGANVIMDLRGDRERNRVENQLQLIRSRTVAKAAIEKLWLVKKNNLDLFGSYPFYPRGKRFRTYLKEITSLGFYDPKNDAPVYYKEDYSDKIGERFASTLISGINLNPRINSDIIDVSYISVWPEEAKLIVNTIVDTYKEFDQILSQDWCDTYLGLFYTNYYLGLNDTSYFNFSLSSPCPSPLNGHLFFCRHSLPYLQYPLGFK